MNALTLDITNKSSEELKEISEKLYGGWEKGQWWLDEHTLLCDKAQNTASQLQFFGDSITAGLSYDANMQKMRKNFAAYLPENFGISGDTTAELLWRLNHGELGGNPKVAVVLIGTNDLYKDFEPQLSAHEIAQCIVYSAQTIRANLNQTKVLVMGILPRYSPYDPLRTELLAKIDSINEMIKQMDDGKMIRVIDIRERFVDSSGFARAELLPDFLHPEESGYEAWSDGIKAIVEQMMMD